MKKLLTTSIFLFALLIIGIDLPASANHTNPCHRKHGQERAKCENYNPKAPHEQDWYKIERQQKRFAHRYKYHHNPYDRRYKKRYYHEPYYHSRKLYDHRRHNHYGSNTLIIDMHDVSQRLYQPSANPPVYYDQHGRPYTYMYDSRGQAYSVWVTQQQHGYEYHRPVTREVTPKQKMCGFKKEFWNQQTGEYGVLFIEKRCNAATSEEKLKNNGWITLN